MAELRIARPTDRTAMHEFFSRLSAGTVQARYLSAWTKLVGPLADREAQRLLDRDESRHVVLVAMHGGGIRGVGEFIIENTGHAAELALVVEDGFQHRGVGRLLYRRLEQLARGRGVAEFTGDVHYRNQLVQRLLGRTGRPVRTQLGYGGVRFTLALGSTSGPA